MVMLSACLLAVSTFGGCAKIQESTAPTTFPLLPGYIMQEVPNPSVLEEHFSLLGIGRIQGYPIGKTKTAISIGDDVFPPANLEQNVSVFHAGENILIYGHAIGSSIFAECFQVGTENYTTINYWGPEPFGGKAPTLQPGVIWVGYTPPDFILPTYLKLTPGQYRMKVFTGDNLVAVFPFEVTEADTATPVNTSMITAISPTPTLSVTLLYPNPKISEAQAFAIAKQLVPASVLYAPRIVTVLSISQPESHGVWTTFFTGLSVTRQELIDFGWREDATTSFGETDIYSQIWIGVDAQTGEVVQKIAWNGIRLGGPVQPNN